MLGKGPKALMAGANVRAGGRPGGTTGPDSTAAPPLDRAETGPPTKARKAESIGRCEHGEGYAEERDDGDVQRCYHCEIHLIDAPASCSARDGQKTQQECRGRDHNSLDRPVKESRRQHCRPEP